MNYTGWNLILYMLFLLILVVETIRSFLHMLLHDGGASSIAGIDTSGTDGSNLISIFGQWGSTQLVLVIMYWILFFKDSSYMTLIFGLLALEYLLRLMEGRIKHLHTSHTPPGAVLAYVMVPLGMLGMVWSYQVQGRWL